METDDPARRSRFLLISAVRAPYNDDLNRRRNWESRLLDPRRAFLFSFFPSFLSLPLLLPFSPSFYFAIGDMPNEGGEGGVLYVGWDKWTGLTAWEC